MFPSLLSYLLNYGTYRSWVLWDKIHEQSFRTILFSRAYTYTPVPIYKILQYNFYIR